MLQLANLYISRVFRRYKTIFLKRSAQGLVFKAFSKIKNPKVELRASEKFNFPKHTNKSLDRKIKAFAFGFLTFRYALKN